MFSDSLLPIEARKNSMDITAMLSPIKKPLEPRPKMLPLRGDNNLCCAKCPCYRWGERTCNITMKVVTVDIYNERAKDCGIEVENG
jgi:hypothetical protein